MEIIIFFKVIQRISNGSDIAEERFGELENGSECKREKQRNYEKEVKMTTLRNLTLSMIVILEGE